MRRLANAKFITLALLCAGAALVMSVLYRDSAVKATVLVVFLLALVAVTHISGRMASLVIAIVASLIFAAWLYEPYGSLTIQNPAERVELLGFGLAAIAVAHLSPRPERQRKPPAD